MWNNIGGKIKALAKVIFWIMAVLSVIGAIGMIVAGADMNSQRYRSYDNPGTVFIVAGIVMLFLGPLFAWIGSFMTYGFGQLIESSEETAFNTRKIADQNNTLLRMNDATASAATQIQRALMQAGQPAVQPPVSAAENQPAPVPEPTQPMPNQVFDQEA